MEMVSEERMAELRAAEAELRKLKEAKDTYYRAGKQMLEGIQHVFDILQKRYGDDFGSWPEWAKGLEHHLLGTLTGEDGFSLAVMFPSARACAARASAPAPAPEPSFQARVHPWMMACFGPEISADLHERSHRFLEEALELAQASGCTEAEARILVEYVYGRAVGDRAQEVGGVMVTLAALCLAAQLDMHACGEAALVEIWEKIDKIRAKRAAKNNRFSPLPVDPPAAVAAVPTVQTEAGGHRLWHTNCPKWMQGYPERNPTCAIMRWMPKDKQRELTIEDGSVLHLCECLTCGVVAFLGLNKQSQWTVRPVEEAPVLAAPT